MDYFSLNSLYQAAAAAGGLSGLTGAYGLMPAYYGLTETYGLAPAYTKFTNALQKALGGRQRICESGDVKEAFTEMQKDPAYEKEVLNMLAESLKSSRGSERTVQEREQAYAQMSMGRGGSLADRLASNRAARLQQRENGRKH